ncbi:hypothetical protein [Xanthobacter versatilis]|uniref:hypothetical protein n=1 Tax=Xanthobacter autotrophicus (strain ATCC BAA-1158 / Py2) TaxID=78245 RepID=UPI003727A5BC
MAQVEVISAEASPKNQKTSALAIWTLNDRPSQFYRQAKVFIFGLLQGKLCAHGPVPTLIWDGGSTGQRRRAEACAALARRKAAWHSRISPEQG